MTLKHRILWLTGLLLLVSNAACLGPTELYPADEADRPVSVYVVTQGWHAGLLTETTRIKPRLPTITQLPDTRYLEFGWGDDRYYAAPDAGIGLLLRAALLPTGAVMHIAGAGPTPESAFSHSTIVRLQISEAGMDALAKFVADHIQTSNDGQADFVSGGLYGEGVFVKANGTYILPNTSNRWTAQALRAAGVPITPIYALTQGNVIWQASRHGDVVQRRP